VCPKKISGNINQNLSVTFNLYKKRVGVSFYILSIFINVYYPEQFPISAVGQSHYYNSVSLKYMVNSAKLEHDSEHNVTLSIFITGAVTMRHQSADECIARKG
jgi:hypothetical protein